MKRILVIRGGAIGDFILTLPAIGLLRNRFPKAHLEILGQSQTVSVAERRFYADAVRSLESAALACFFTRTVELDSPFAKYFATFDLIISYLFDPDRLFERNVSRCSPARFISVSPKSTGREHAARELARPLITIGLQLSDEIPKIFPSPEDQAAARSFRPTPGIIVALHPGSGSAAKNWPLQHWIHLGNHLLGNVPTTNSLVVIGGEADVPQMQGLKSEWSDAPVQFAENLPLPHLAALLQGALFVGHDSGISHLAAAAGARCVLLFGPTDPEVWAPANSNVEIIRAPNGKLSQLPLHTVLAAVERAYELMRIGIKT